MANAYEEIYLALQYYFDVDDNDCVDEIIGQERDPISTIAQALNKYREY